MKHLPNKRNCTGSAADTLLQYFVLKANPDCDDFGQDDELPAAVEVAMVAVLDADNGVLDQVSVVRAAATDAVYQLLVNKARARD